ncbi:MAG TPA: hypothetical protein VM008_04575 [Phycisphaerae bacterium]|nr:hypothetical protein [Phycisphaerae bacterium]
MSHKTLLIAFLLTALTDCNRSGPSSTATTSEHFQTQTFTASTHPDHTIVLLTASLCATFTGNDRILAGYTRHENRLRLEPFQWNAAPVRNFIVTSDGLIEEPIGIGERFLSSKALRDEQFARILEQRERERRTADEEFRKKVDEELQRSKEHARHPGYPQPPKPLDSGMNSPLNIETHTFRPPPRNPQAYHF